MEAWLLVFKTKRHTGEFKSPPPPDALWYYIGTASNVEEATRMAEEIHKARMHGATSIFLLMNDKEELFLFPQ